MLETAKNIFYQARTKPYEQLAEEEEFFVKTYPLVTKYMCAGRFDEQAFAELLQKKETRVGFMESFRLQTEYLKSMLVHQGFSKMEANKVANNEMGHIEVQINKIKKQEKQFSKRNVAEKKQNAEERRREFGQFLSENPKISDPVMVLGAEWLTTPRAGHVPFMIQRGEVVEFADESTDIQPTDLVFLIER